VRVVELLGQRRGEITACDPMLAWAGQHDADPDVCGTAAKLLGS
jgi:hypothetical protein